MEVEGYRDGASDIVVEVSDAGRLKSLESENARLKKLLAEPMLENEATRDALQKKALSAAARRELQWMKGKGLSERRSVRVIGMSANALRSIAFGAIRRAA